MASDVLGFGWDDMRARSKAALDLYLNPPPPIDEGPRVGRDVRGLSVVPSRCYHCQEWLPQGSRAEGRCRACGIPLN